MQRGGRYEADIVELNILGQTRFVRPYGDIVRDCHGNKAGYLEVASDVSELVMKERDLHAHMERMEKVNAELVSVAGQVADATGAIESQTEGVMRGTENQRGLITESVTAIEQMNADRKSVV